MQIEFEPSHDKSFDKNPNEHSSGPQMCFHRLEYQTFEYKRKMGKI